jgi:UDP:flavonoid glycosyltransferase YjiC (YdhE family)
MKVTLLAIGTRGDVQPVLALARELADAGHQVRMATYRSFEPLVERVGLAFAPLAEGRISAGDTPESRRWIETHSRYLPTWVGYLKDARSVLRERLADALEACADSDVIVASDLATLLGWQMADHFGQPLIRVNLNLPARASGWHGAIPNAMRQAAWRAARVWLDAARKDVGLPVLPAAEPLSGLDRCRTLVLRAYSAAVGALPAPGRDWIKVTGYWFLGQQLDPDLPARLLDFIAAGSPPVCIDFGSMLEGDPEDTIRLVIEALDRAGRRGILIRGRHRQSEVDLPASVLGVDSAPHDVLFGRCAAVVHHAGAGTTAAVLRAGVPSVPVPHTVDQVRWSRRIHELGVASAPIPRRGMSTSGLHAGIVAVTEDARMSSRAAALKETVRTENGTVRAREILEEHFGRGFSSPGMKVPVPTANAGPLEA